METVFILGAGASKEAGGPLISDFIDKAEKLYRVQLRHDKNVSIHFEDVFNGIAELSGVFAKSNIDLDNIETLLGIIEMAYLIENFGKRDLEPI